ncbi:MAG: MBL fold metallo-hydrolase [Desulfocucumaceae bacterium]
MEVAPNIYCVRLPLPFKLDHVNCYLLKGKNGWKIIDTGLNYPLSTSVWEKSFNELGLKFGDIEGIFITHYHPDHYGASGWLQELTGAPVYIHSIDYNFVDQMWKKGRINVPVIGELFKENGMPPNLLAEVLDNLTGIFNFIHPHPSLSQLSGGEMVELGGRIFEVIHTPGHSDGHISFFCEEEGILFSGDHLLPRISSNISLWPTSNPNPLGLFLDSLKKIKTLPVRVVIPAHGEPFGDSVGRVDELLEHHQGRLALVFDLVGAGSNAYNICTSLFGTDLSLHEFRFALTETLAHLAFLEDKSLVFSRQEGGIVIYRKTK